MRLAMTVLCCLPRRRAWLHWACALLLLSVTATAFARASGIAPDPCARAAVPATSTANARPGGKAIPYSPGLLWLIQSPDGHSSYLFGTLHSSAPRVTHLPVQVQQAIRASQRMAVEVTIDADAGARYRNAMFSDRDNLYRLLDMPMFIKAVQMLAGYGVRATDSARMKPWAAFNILGRPKPDQRPVLDSVLIQLAQAQHMRVDGLESMDELVAALDSIPVPDQLVILTDTICQHDDVAAQDQQITELYLRRDTAGMLAIAYPASPGDTAVHERFMQTMLVDRSERMAQRMTGLLSKGGVFIAVGALHLPGDDGVLARLHAAGYRITRVY